MRKILGYFVFLILLLSGSIFALEVTLQWDPNSEPDLAGYKVYYKANSSGKPSGDYDVVIDVGMSTSKTINQLNDNTIYYFAVTAYDEAGLESDFSEEVNTGDIPNKILTPVEGLITEGNGINKTIGPYEYEGFSGGVFKFSWGVAVGATRYEFKLTNISNLTTVINGETGNNNVEITLPKVGVYEFSVRSCNTTECTEWSMSTNPSVSLVDGSARAWVIRAKLAPAGKPVFQ